MKNKRTAFELNEVLWGVIDGLKDKTLKVSEAKEITNAAGKIIQIALTQLQANAMGAQVPVDLLDIPEGTIHQIKPAKQKRLQALA